MSRLLRPGGLYVGNTKGACRIYQQTFIDTYSKVAKIYDRKTPITAAEILNDRVLPFFEEQGTVLCVVTSYSMGFMAFRKKNGRTIDELEAISPSTIMTAT
jgi:hypothetical protein